MNIHQLRDDITLYEGDCREVLRVLSEESVQLVVTSPPYWAKRSYGIPPVEWPSIEYVPLLGAPPVTIPAWMGCLGDEETALEYVGHMVFVFRMLRRVLKPDGVVFVNMGDTYASKPPGVKGVSGSSGLNGARGGRYRETLTHTHGQKRNTVTGGLKPKDMAAVPWRVALALQADGWFLRSDIIWHKDSTPEAVRDRPTVAHEYVFLLSKSERYYYDADAILEPTADGSGRRNKRSVWRINADSGKHGHRAAYPEDLVEPCILAGSRPGDCVLDPFNGSGTTGLVALREGRRYIGIEMNPEFITITKSRLGQQRFAV